MNTLDRFNEKFVMEPNSGCWIWTAALYAHGYGAFYYQNRVRLAHRVAYYLFKGEIPEGYELDHLCRVRCCVNPDHLEVVTRRENLLRSPITPVNRTHCPSGHEYTTDNVWLDQKSGRRCKICKAQEHKMWKWRRGGRPKKRRL